MRILFNNIGKTKNYLENVELLYSNYELFRQKHFSNLCLNILQPIYPNSKLYLTHSATGALEMIALMLDIEKGDEIIMPSYTFVSTANAFVSRGAKPIFIDIEEQSLTIDLDKVESAITSKTKAIIAIHYAGHAGDLMRLKSICERHNLYLIEDAAMSFGNTYHQKALGSIGDFGVISFDITKQISAVQGGLLLVNNQQFKNRAGKIYHIGTNREDFMEGTAPYYEWEDVGSKFQNSELNAIALYDQLGRYQEILAHRNRLSILYYEQLKSLAENGKFKLMDQRLLDENYHEFYILLSSETERKELSRFLLQKGIESMFHYVALHTSAKGKSFGTIDLPITSRISDTLLRLPLHTEMDVEEVMYIVKHIKAFFYAT